MAESAASSEDKRPDSQCSVGQNRGGEDDRLARWVRAVVLRWTATGVSARDRTRLFAGLLHELVLAPTRRTGVTQLVNVEPDTVADQLAARRSASPGPSTAQHISRRKQRQRLPWT